MFTETTLFDYGSLRWKALDYWTAITPITDQMSWIKTETSLMLLIFSVYLFTFYF